MNEKLTINDLDHAKRMLAASVRRNFLEGAQAWQKEVERIEFILVMRGVNLGEGKEW
jgi:hypothetical protein